MPGPTAFCTELVEALRAKGRTVWVDLEGLLAGEQWWSRVCEAIDASHHVVAVLSPSWAASTTCRAELEHATHSAKRILPVVHQRPGASALLAIVASTKWFFALEEPGRFAEGRGTAPDAGQRPGMGARAYSLATARPRLGPVWPPPDLLLSGDHLAEAELDHLSFSETRICLVD
jgi:hypothetical protein